MKKGKESLGAIPTPTPIVKLMIRLAIDHHRDFFNKNSDSEYMSILDNSVGDGRFLFEFMKAWKNLKKRNHKKSRLILHGLDINDEMINECKSKNNKLVLTENIKPSFKMGNALIGYIKAREINKKHHTKEDLNISYFTDLGINRVYLKLKDTAFHWFYEWPVPNATDGYDLCIGNPPFGISFSLEEKYVYKKIYEGVDPEVESYLLFLERSIDLLREGGTLIFLVPNNFTTNYRYQKFRKFLLENLLLKQIIMLDDKIFPEVSVETCIIIGNKRNKDEREFNNEIEFSRYSIENNFSQIRRNKQHLIMGQKFRYIVPDMVIEITKILETMEKDALLLKDIADISRGIELGFNSESTSDVPISNEYVPLIAGRNIRKFAIKGEKRYIEFNINQKSIFKEKSLYTNPKILLRRIGHELMAVYDPNKFFCVCDVYLITFKSSWSHFPLEHLEILLNSSLFTFYLNHKFKTVKRIFPKIPISYLKQLPIKLPFSVVDKEKIENLSRERENMLKEKMHQLDEIIFKHYNISKSQKQMIDTFKPIT